MNSDYILWGIAFWLGFFGFWLMLWNTQFRNRRRTHESVPYATLRSYAIAIAVMFAVGFVAAALMVPLKFLPVSAAALGGAAVGLGHFLVFPAAWWRGRRGTFWDVE